LFYILGLLNMFMFSFVNQFVGYDHHFSVFRPMASSIPLLDIVGIMFCRGCICVALVRRLGCGAGCYLLLWARKYCVNAVL
jgi:hypothetical protein